MDVLLEAYGDSLSETDQHQFEEKTEGKPIKTRFDEFMNAYDNHVKKDFDSQLKSSLATYLGGLFQVIRNQRNDAGHQTGEKIEREQLYAKNTAFPDQFH